ncbi:Flavonoid 3',5'-hydroxylase [Thalictrum thalictroides]|uniref:Flavonoid 3',5'-hydroxylase n=1 Tax=Thalictrum thalictroides TaxID=46969 RepID=A0A7J6WFL4_THATH|nr:Flavonoid 3',5'-hydroxylase [Thalictrum thalictroides]
MAHVKLADMSKTYGPIMYLKLGARGLLVASTPQAAYTFFKTLDSNFSNRPSCAFGTHAMYNSQDMVFGKYGKQWMLLRKLSNLHMFCGKAIEDWTNVRRLELGHMLQAMYKSSTQGEPVVLTEMLGYAIANIISQVAMSKRVFVTKSTESDEFKDMIAEAMLLAGMFDIGDFVPSIAWMDLHGNIKRMKSLNNRFDPIFKRIVKERITTKHERKEKPDLLDALIDCMDNNPLADQGVELTETNIKALILDLFIAGGDTTSGSIEWALAEMMINPSILSRAQAEMDQQYAETLRKHPSVALNLRESIEPCELNGYYIPKGTRVSVNIWAIGRDPNVWENPLEFNPDRFLTEKNAAIDLSGGSGNNFELKPFGAGRRICPGERMGIVLLEYILGTPVHSFEWKVPDGEKLNMEETFGLAIRKSVPLAAIVTPCLPPSAYAVV